MGHTGLESVVDMLDRVFDGVDVGQASNQQTRISIISYASKARIMSNLSTYYTFSQFKAGLASIQLTSHDPVVGLYEAFEAFDVVINEQQSDNVEAATMKQNLKQQVNRKVVCIVFASAYDLKQRDPTVLVQKIRDDGHYVLTVSAMATNGDPTDAQRIGSMASEGMNFTIDREATRVLDNIVNATSLILMAAIDGITVGQGLVHQTRIGLLTFSANATILGTLKHYKNKRDVQFALATLRPSDDSRVNLLAGLKAAKNTWNEVSGSLTRQVVFVLVASAYSGKGATDPALFAKQLKESGVKILTIAFIRNNEGDEEVEKISDLASTGFSFRTDRDQTTLADKLQKAFCRANCFCPSGWVQFADDFQKPTTKYAECVRFSSSPSSWFGASLSCANEVNRKAFLASERSEAKHKFLADYVRGVNGRMKPYFIGLSWDNASRQYIWSEKFDNGTQIPLDPSAYQGWASGNGNHGQTSDGVQVAPFGFHMYWYDVDRFRTSSDYMCQVNACDTDNYCDDSVDDDE